MAASRNDHMLAQSHVQRRKHVCKSARHMNIGGTGQGVLRGVSVQQNYAAAAASHDRFHYPPPWQHQPFRLPQKSDAIEGHAAPVDENDDAPFARRWQERRTGLNEWA